MWVSTVDDRRLVDLRPVQALEGVGSPFERLVAVLSAGRFMAAGIDAPFCIPARHMPAGGHDALVKAVGAMEAAVDRPFPRGAALVDMAKSVAGLESAKPLRATELVWKLKGLNVRSALWNGPRGGAPFAVACLSLLARAGRPVWPWRSGEGMLVEAFPAAQVKQWLRRLPSYGRPDQQAARIELVALVEARLEVPEALKAMMLESADALDATLAAFGAMAAASGDVTDDPPPIGSVEGAIAVHR